MPAKEYIIRKAPSGAQTSLMLAKFEAVWSEAARRPMPVKLGDMDSPEILYEREPEVQEIEEEGKAAIERMEDRVRRGILSRARKSRRGWRWILRDRDRVRAEKDQLTEAKAKEETIHDIHTMPLEKGVQLVAKKEGLTKLASSTTKVLPSGKQAKYEQASDNARGRYAVMMQTGPNEVTMAPLGEWWTFRPLKQLSNAPLGARGPSLRASIDEQSRLGRMRAKLLAKRETLVKEENDGLQGDGSSGSGRTGGRKGKRGREVEEDEGRYDGADQLGLTAEDGEDAAAVEGRGEDGLDLTDANRSDDEGFQDGKGDEETLDTNNATWAMEAPDSESEDEIEQEVVKDVKNAKPGAAFGSGDGEDAMQPEEEVQQQKEDGGLSNIAKRLISDASSSNKKRSRDEETPTAKPSIATGNSDKRLRTSTSSLPGPPPPPAAKKPTTAPPGPKLSSSLLVTEKNVRDLLELANGRMEIKAFFKRFKKATKQDKGAKDELKAILQRIVQIEENPAEGRMLVLKGRR